ncbi:MAG: hypothetical protein KDC98_06815 [Planctomycetes bacterium]|nr:hypothetical protein [Planctomycetota bacterium]
MTNLADLPAAVLPLDRPPLALATALRGNVVAMLFWRAGCVHSRQALADLVTLPGELEGEPFAVVAVHVPSVEAERDPARVRRIVSGLPAAVTVLLDDERALAGALAITALPSLVLFDAAGDLCFSGRGEPNRRRLFDAVEVLLTMASESGRAARVPFAPPAASPRFALQPTALAADADGLWIGAAGHDRAYRVSADGEVERSIDGLGRASGMCVHVGRLFVSDSTTHQLRAFDLADADTGARGERDAVADLIGGRRDSQQAAPTWTTVLGTGRRSTDRFGGGFGIDQGLCSPAGLLAHEGAIYCAQAGAHQVWQFDPETLAATPWMGTGARMLRDGGDEATFAEPLALAASADELYVADAGNGAVRAIELAHNFARTIAQNVQRPCAVAVRGDQLFVLAAWQPALLVMPRSGGSLEVWFGAEHGLVEPVALELVADTLWIADVGADCLFAVDLEAPSPTLRRVELRDWAPVAPAATRSGAAQVMAPIEVREFSDVELSIPLPHTIGAPVGHGTRCEVDILDEGEPVLAADRHLVVQAAADHVAVLIPITGSGQGTLRVVVSAAIGAATRTYRHLVPVLVSPTGALQTRLRPARQPATGAI